MRLDDLSLRVIRNFIAIFCFIPKFKGRDC